MAETYIVAQGIVSRKRPQFIADGQRAGAPFRSGKYGEEYNLSLIPKNHLLADEGSYFVFTNPTPGTGIVGAAAMTGVPTPGANTDLNPYFVIYNSAQPTDGTRVYFDALQMLCTQAGTAGTNLNFAVQLDTWANRVKQGAAITGTLLTGMNCNSDDGQRSVTQVWMGANTILGSSGAAGGGAGVRLLPHRLLKSSICAANDVYTITFGASEQFLGPSATLVSYNYPPIIIGPQQVALVYLWAASQTSAASFEGDLSLWER